MSSSGARHNRAGPSAPCSIRATAALCRGASTVHWRHGRVAHRETAAFVGAVHGPHRLPARLSRFLQPLGDGPARPHYRNRRQPPHAVDRRVHLRQGAALRPARVQPRPPPAPDRCARAPKGSGQFRRASWDEALDLVAGRIDEAREIASAPSPSFPITTADRTAFSRTISKTHGSSVASARRGSRARSPTAPATVAAAAAMYGRWRASAYPDYEHARLIVVWGANPSALGRPSGDAHQARASTRRAPRRDRSAAHPDRRRLADLHLPVRPGTDLVVALAVIARTLRSRTGRTRRFSPRTRAASDALRAVARGVAARTRGGRSRCGRGRAPHIRRVVRHDVTGGDSVRMGPGTQSQRRIRDARDSGAARRSAESSACAAAGTR